VPNRDHSRVLEKVQEDRKAEDVFPTVYRCNSRGKLLRALRQHGLDGVVYGYESEPKYLQFSRFAYRIGVLYQRIAPRGLGNALFAFARKLPNEGAGA
jgi:hypothetical protein